MRRKSNTKVPPFVRTPPSALVQQWQEFIDVQEGERGFTQANRNRFLLAHLDLGTPPRDIREIDRRILLLWNQAFESGEARTAAPTRMFRHTFLTQSRKPWSDEDFAKLVDPVRHQHPTRKVSLYLKSGISRVGYWIAFFRLTQELRLHRSVVRSIRFDQIDATKRDCDLTDHPFVGFSMPITVPTIRAIEAIRYPLRETILDQDVKRCVENYQYQQALKRIGVSHRPGGVSKARPTQPISSEVDRLVECEVVE